MKTLTAFFPGLASKKSHTRTADRTAGDPAVSSLQNDANLKVQTLPQALPQDSSAASSPAMTVGVLGAKGGCGTTTVALNLAAALSRLNGNTCFVDANLQNPDAVVLLGREPRFSLVDLVARHNEMDAALVEACSTQLVETEGGTCRLLSGPADGSGARVTNLSHLAACIESLTGFSDNLVIDLPKYLDKHLVTMLDKMDMVVLVFEATIPGIAAARRWLKVFAELDYPADKILPVLNRSGSRLRTVESDLPALLGRPFHKLPNAFMLTQECASAGAPAVVHSPKDKFTLAVTELSGLLLRAASKKQQTLPESNS